MTALSNHDDDQPLCLAGQGRPDDEPAGAARGGAGVSELRIQAALRAGRTPEHLADELGIEATAHPDLPLVIFNYDMIDSPKTHPIVREARALVLERGTWNVVAKSFGRFFNCGEDADSFRSFVWPGCTATSKEDGSLMVVYHYAGEWHVNTRRSFGYGAMPNGGKSWREMFWSLLPARVVPMLDTARTYVFELCTLWNKVVRSYAEPTLFLLAVVDRSTLHEESDDECDYIALTLGLQRPQRFRFSGYHEVETFLAERENSDPTFEGIILRDRNNLRFKAKSKTYVSLHHLADNGALINPKNLIPWCLKDDPSELLAYFPEARPFFEEVKAKIDAEWTRLVALWQDTRAIPSQKDFALAVKDATPFSGILFTLRKVHGAKHSLDLLRAEWRDAGDVILKRLFKDAGEPSRARVAA